MALERVSFYETSNSRDQEQQYLFSPVLKRAQETEYNVRAPPLYPSLLSPPKPPPSRVPRTFRHSRCPVLKTFPSFRSPISTLPPIARLVALSRSTARRPSRLVAYHYRPDITVHDHMKVAGNLDRSRSLQRSLGTTGAHHRSRSAPPVHIFIIAQATPRHRAYPSSVSSVVKTWHVQDDSMIKWLSRFSRPTPNLRKVLSYSACSILKPVAM
jgi:hypothetical protein